ncbi:MAG: hypothetical protein M1305_01925 [Candidatus Marsarchaeota archaeon]|nr:hypothetical protein [Candidatus Marsarchaeota archaeon]
MTQEVSSLPISVRASRHALGSLLAILVVNTRAEFLADPTRAVAIGWGFNEIATAADSDYDLPAHDMTEAARLPYANPRWMDASQREI